MFLPKESLRELYDRNYQRRQTAIEATGRLTPDEFTRDVKTGWRSVRNALLHIMEAETFWVGLHAVPERRVGHSPGRRG